MVFIKTLQRCKGNVSDRAIFGRKYKELGDRSSLGRRETAYLSKFWVTNLSKINILYASVDNTHQAKNGLKKEKK